MEQQQQQRPQHAASGSGGGACLLPFPAKFHSARLFVEGLPRGSELLSDDAWLALDALYSQATKGPCHEPKRWGLTSLSSASPTEAAWRELGEMPQSEAMRLYVRVLDEEAPGWWRAVGAVGSSGSAAAGEKEEGGEGEGDAGRAGSSGTGDEGEDADVGRWVRLSATPDSSSSSSSASASSSSASSPCPRYEHAAALLGRALFVVGGSRAGGRMLSDSWALDLETLRWSNLFPPGGGGGSLPPRAGLCLLPWKKPGSAKPACLLAIGGHAPKSGRGGPAPTEMEVWKLEPTASASSAGARWTLVPTGVAGGGGTSPPPPRGGHSVTVIPGTSRAFVFGGEVDGDGRGPSSDLFELDLDSMTWRGPLRVRGSDGNGDRSKKKNAAAPAPRSGHVAAAVGRFLVVFGGADGDRVFGDVAVLDVDALEWLRPQVEIKEDDGESDDESNDGENDENDDEKRRRRRQRGKGLQSKRRLVVSPRAGASAAVIGKTVFVAGGGDGSDSHSSTFDAATLALDCSRLPHGPLIWRRAARDDDGGESSLSSPASSEGLALIALPRVRALLAFGGNAGRLHANLAVLRPKAGVIVNETDDEEDDDEEEANGAAASDDDNEDEIAHVEPTAPRPSAAAAAAAGATAAATAASACPSPSELALMRRQLASAQASAADAASRAEDAEKEAERLRGENERLRRRLAAVLNGDDDSEDDDEENDNGLSGAVAPTKGGSEISSRRPRVWAYISGA